MSHSSLSSICGTDSPLCLFASLLSSYGTALQDSDEEGTRAYSAATGGASRGTGSGRKRKASPVDRKPAMPQYAVKRKELAEGWDEEGSDDDEEDLIADMDGNMGGWTADKAWSCA